MRFQTMSVLHLTETRWCTVLSLIIFGVAFTTSNELVRADDSFRLPRAIQPVRYNLVIEPNLESRTFNGSVMIQLRILENTENITIHVRELDINEDSIQITHFNGSEVKFINTTSDKKRQFYIINLEEELQKDNDYNLSIQYSGRLNFDNVGFYLARYKDPEGKERILALTDFQPAGARKAFPCFDEPGLKAKFTINIIRSENYTSISNEKLASSIRLQDDRFKDTFQETVNMSTYLVAFSVSDYEHTVQNGRFRIYAKPEAIHIGQVDYVLSFSEDLLNELEDFTNINYSLSKLDMFGIPSDYFEPGGMENWGLLTYSEPNLFCSNISTMDLQNCMSFTGHELAHQWFGNLVTPSWWKYLWLSEGFTTYLQYYIPSILKPSWNLMDQFVLLVQQKVLTYDGITVNQPLNYNPEHANGFPSLIIAYYKGACILRMARHFLTKDVFESGVKTYLQKNQFGIVEPSDLYDAFQQAINETNAHELLGNQNIFDILRTWDSNSGYPLVQVIRNYENGSIIFSQNKFVPKALSEFDRKWSIPINYVFGSDTEKNYSKTTADFWFTKKMIILHDFPTTSWTLLNKLQTGYFRVNYDVTNWNRLIMFLNTENFTDIPILNRAQLIDDAFALAQRDYLSFEIPLNLSKYLVQEKEYIPLATFLNAIETLKILMTATENYEIFKSYIIHLLSGAYNHLGYEEKPEDTHLDKLNRIKILTWLCDLGFSKCRDAGLEELRKWKLNNETFVPLDLQTPLFCGAMHIGTEDDWNFLYEKYKSLRDYSHQNRILSSLACSENETVIKRFLDFVFDKNSELSLGERHNAFQKVVQSGNKGLDAALNYVTKNIFQKKEIFSKTKVGRNLGKYITTSKHKDQLSKMEYLILDDKFVLRTAMVYAKGNLDLLAKDYIQDISNWLVDYEENHSKILL